MDSQDPKLIKAMEILIKDPEKLENYLQNVQLSQSDLDYILLETLLGPNDLYKKIIALGARASAAALKTAITSVNVPAVKYLINDLGLTLDSEMVQLALDTNDPELIIFVKRTFSQGPNLQSITPPSQAALQAFNELVTRSAQDLESFTPDQITSLRKYLRVPANLPIDQLCKEMARKIMYAHTEKLPEDNKKCTRYNMKFTPNKIANIRSQVHNKFKKFADNVGDMTIADLHDLFNLYDDLCFKGNLSKYMAEKKFGFEFKLEGEPTFTTTGICIPSKTGQPVCDYTMTIPMHFFKNATNPTNVAGDLCTDQLECLQRVIEHEMVHLVIFMFCGDHYASDQHGKLFMNMVGDLFGHTDYKHYL